MIRRILFTTAAAAALLAASPALAEGDHPYVKQQCSCCSDGSSSHAADHALREGKKAADRVQQPKTEDDPYIRNQSFGG